MRKGYSLAQKTEAVALRNVIGVEAAADQLVIDKRSIEGWALKAGYGRVLDVAPDQWQALHDLAIAKTTAAVASGSLPVRTVAIIAATAVRRRHRSPPMADPGRASVSLHRNAPLSPV